MKRILFLFLSSLLVLPICAQLNADHNSLRAGDVIIKQQVEFKDPGEAGASLLWDFSQLESINDEYELEYSTAPLVGDSVYVMGYNQFNKKTAKSVDLIVGTEHNTMYYFYQTLDSLLLLGHENVAIKQENYFPVVNLQFPFSYGQQTSSSYKTRGLYSGTMKVQSEGNIKIHADAFGALVLPSGDTINPVLRVKTEQTILDTSKDVISTIENDKGRMLESYKWYSKGYRYPIFETVRSVNLNDSADLFSTAFFYPPQDHLYLDTDPENLALLDKLWEYTEDNINDFENVNLFNNGNDNPNNCKLYPNPVESLLNIEYTLEKNTPVNIILCTVDGKVVKNIFKKMQEAGDQHEVVDCSNMIFGSYFVKIVAGDMMFNGKILKK